MGFDDSEARENIENPQFELDADGLFMRRERPAPVFRQTFNATPEDIEALERVWRSGQPTTVTSKSP
jgi:hypothetical protein